MECGSYRGIKLLEHAMKVVESISECRIWQQIETDHMQNLGSHKQLHLIAQGLYTVSQKNILTLKRYSSKLRGAILMKFGRNIQNTLE